MVAFSQIKQHLSKSKEEIAMLPQEIQDGIENFNARIKDLARPIIEEVKEHFVTKEEHEMLAESVDRLKKSTDRLEKRIDCLESATVDLANRVHNLVVVVEKDKHKDEK